jgi:polyphosphate kinase 2 (PPK2 family)
MLGTVDLSLSLKQDIYQRLLDKHQAALRNLAYQVFVQQRLMILVFEGWNASGKGEAIRCVTESIDPRGFVVYPISAPTVEEASRHYLWRYWRLLPETGQIAIFDRSWYRRVLVERVENLCSENEWQRAYREINHFERQLVDFGAILFKFWLHIDRDEQLRRFESRAIDPINPWRSTAEDWRSQENWEHYEQAANEMLSKCNTIETPWTIIEANSEAFAQVKILRTLVGQLSPKLNYDPFLVEKHAKKKKKKRQAVNSFEPS